MMTTEKALREALAVFLDLCPRMSDDDPIAPALADACKEARAALSLPETQGECDELNDRNIQQRALIEDLAAMCRRMSYALARQGTNDTTVKQCVALLKKHDLGGSVVREMAPPSQPAQGWKLVPVEPTPKMSAAGLCVSEAEHDPAGVYRARLAPAPAAPTNGEGA